MSRTNKRTPSLGSLVLARWDDAWCVPGNADDEPEELLVETVGWLIKRTRQSLYVAAEKIGVAPTDPHYRGVTRIPLKMLTQLILISSPN